MAFDNLDTFIAGITNIGTGRELFLRAVNVDLLKAQIIDLNQKQMYDMGIDAEGESLGEYSRASVEFYGKPAGHIRLYDTGDFYRSMHVVFGADSIFIFGDTNKPSRDLASMWPHALGLTDESQAELRPEIKERVIELIKKTLGG